MQKLEKFLFKGISIIMAFVAVFWLFTSTKLFYESSSFFFTLLLVLILFIVLLFPRLIGNFVRFISKHKIYFLVGTVIFQLLVLFSTSLMIRSDASVVYNSSIGKILLVSAQNYFTENSNNIPLFLYEYFFHKLFPNNGIWYLQLLNIVYIDLSLLLFYATAKKFFQKEIADYFFTFYLFIIVLTPQFVAMYTDIMGLPIIALQFYFILSFLCKKRRSMKILLVNSLLLSLITGVGYFIRPTIVISLFAFVLCYLFIIDKKLKILPLVTVLLSFCLVFLSVKNIVYSQKIINNDLSKSKNALTFIDLGLTYSGGDQIDFQKGLAMYVGKDGTPWRYSKEVVSKDIKRRLSEYNLSTFTGHILTKQSMTTSDGTLGWVYDDTQTGFINPLYDRLSKNRILGFIRTHFVYINYPEYKSYKLFLQFCWIIIILGLLMSLLRYEQNSQNNFMLLALLGGILFLLIFEGGKSRYMIQFLPQLIILSSVGYFKMENKVKGKNNGKGKKFYSSKQA